MSSERFPLRFAGPGEISGNAIQVLTDGTVNASDGTTKVTFSAANSSMTYEPIGLFVDATLHPPGPDDWGGSTVLEVRHTLNGQPIAVLGQLWITSDPLAIPAGMKSANEQAQTGAFQSPYSPLPGIGNQFFVNLRDRALTLSDIESIEVVVVSQAPIQGQITMRMAIRSLGRARL